MKANNTRSEAAGSSRIYGLFSRFHESRCLWDLHCPSPQLIIGLSAMKDPCSELPNTSAGGAAACPEVCPAWMGRKALTPGRVQAQGSLLKPVIPALGHRPRGAGGSPAHRVEGCILQPPGLRSPGGSGGAGRCAAARPLPPPGPAPPSPAGPPRPGTKHTAPILSAFVAIWQIHVDTANIHLFRHIMSRNREQLELCLLLLLMRMGDREREREKKNHLTIRDIQLIMNHMCL